MQVICISYLKKLVEPCIKIKLSTNWDVGPSQPIPHIVSRFESDRGGWVPGKSVWTTLQDGRLRVSGINWAWEGVSRDLTEFTIAPGKTLKISLQIDKGNTNAPLRLLVREMDNNGKHLSWNVVEDNLQTGIQNYAYTIKSASKASLKIDKPDTLTHQTSYYYIDNVVVSE